MQYVGTASKWIVTAVASWPITIPGTVQAGDFGILIVSFDSVTANTTTIPGWTQVKAQFSAGTMSSQIFTRTMTAGETTVDITTSPGQSGTATAFWLRGVTGINQTGAYGIRSGSIFTVAAPGITTTERRPIIALFGDRTIMANAGEYDAINSLTWGTVLAQGENNPSLSASTGIPAHWLVGWDQAAAGATGDNTATMQDSSGNAWGVVMALDPVSTTYSQEVLADAPLMYNRLGGTDATTIKVDSSGNARTATTVIGNLAYVQPALITYDWATKFTNPSALQWTNTAWMNPTSISVEAWINCTNIGGSQLPTICDRWYGGGQAFTFRIATNGKLTFAFFTAAGGAFTCTSVRTLENGVSYHVAATYEPTTGVASLYIDGVLDASLTVAASALKSATSDLHVGGGYAGGFGLSATSYFSGRIDEIAYYGTALSAARVLAHYNAGTALSTAVRSVDVFEPVAASSGAPTRSMDAFELLVTSAGSVARRNEAFEVVVAASFTQAVAANDLWVWDGTTEIPANVTIWDGTAEIPTTVSVT